MAKKRKVRKNRKKSSPKTKIVHRLRKGKVQLSVLKNKYGYSFIAQRNYYSAQDEEWKTSDFFALADISDFILLLFDLFFLMRDEIMGVSPKEDEEELEDDDELEEEDEDEDEDEDDEDDEDEDDIPF